MSSRIGLAIVLVAMMWQFIGHKLWFYYPEDIRVIFWILLTIGIVPYIYGFRKGMVSVVTTKESSTPWLEIGLFSVFVLVLWVSYVWSNLRFPVHVYGDESHHFQRILHEITFSKSLIKGTEIEFPFAFFIFYPAVGYIPAVMLCSIIEAAAFNIEAIVVARQSLGIWLILILFAVWKLLDELNVTEKVSRWSAMGLVATIPVLWAYQISFYIELPYIPLQLFSTLFCLRYLKVKDDTSWFLAIGLAALATLVRESAWPFAFCIGGFLSITGLFERRYLRALWAPLGALLPFLLYYLARHMYSGGAHDGSRIGFWNLFEQDWSLLFIQSPIYLGLALIVGFSCFWWTAKKATHQEQRIALYVVLPTLILTLFEYGLFLTPTRPNATPDLAGWMPWSRNYLMVLGSSIYILLLAVKYLPNIVGINVASSIVGIAFLGHFYVLAYKYESNIYFHENEAIFQVSKVIAAIPLGVNKQAYECRPAFMKHADVNQVIVNVCPDLNYFQNWEQVKRRLPQDADYVLYYHYKNRSMPRALSDLPTASPFPFDDPEYRLISRVDDPFSDGTIGVNLIAHRFKVNTK